MNAKSDQALSDLSRRVLAHVRSGSAWVSRQSIASALDVDPQALAHELRVLRGRKRISARNGLYGLEYAIPGCDATLEPRPDLKPKQCERDLPTPVSTLSTVRANRSAPQFEDETLAEPQVQTSTTNSERASKRSANRTANPAGQRAGRSVAHDETPTDQATVSNGAREPAATATGLSLASSECEPSPSNPGAFAPGGDVITIDIARVALWSDGELVMHDRSGRRFSVAPAGVRCLSGYLMRMNHNAELTGADRRPG